ncbi:Methyltransferase type 11 domain protein [Candidatus Magnetomorum sp. HK-1]|nr:Methyltransferase type 11 domain protein [Candidatus Magnetomorum sp. HK-1]
MNIKSKINEVLNESYKKLNLKKSKLEKEHIEYNSIEYLEVHINKIQIILKSLYSKYKDLNNIKILDVGVGSGLSSLIYAQTKALVTAIDFNKELKQNSYLVNNNIPFHICNIEKEALPFEDNSFDIILFNEVLEHLSESVDYPLAEMKRVLKEKGFLILSVPSVHDIQCLLRLILRENIYPPVNEFYKPLFENNGNKVFDRHMRLYAKKEVYDLLTRIGYKVEKIKYINPGKIKTGTWWKKPFILPLKCLYTIPIVRSIIYSESIKTNE